MLYDQRKIILKVSHSISPSIQKHYHLNESIVLRGKCRKAKISKVDFMKTILDFSYAN